MYIIIISCLLFSVSLCLYRRRHIYDMLVIKSSPINIRLFVQLSVLVCISLCRRRHVYTLIINPTTIDLRLFVCLSSCLCFSVSLWLSRRRHIYASPKIQISVSLSPCLAVCGSLSLSVGGVDDIFLYTRRKTQHYGSSSVCLSSCMSVLHCICLCRRRHTERQVTRLLLCCFVFWSMFPVFRPDYNRNA